MRHKGFVYSISPISGEGAIIKKYEGTNKKVVVPAVIKGHKVFCIDDHCFKNSEIEEIEIPDSVEVLGSGCFCGCRSLKRIKLPRTLKRVGAICFAWSGVEEIEIPEGVNIIGNCCFWDCKQLKCIKLPNIPAVMGDCLFRGCSALCEIEGDSGLDRLGLYRAFGDGGYRDRVCFPRI